MTTPQRIAIVGGHGKVALALIPTLLGRDRAVVPLARREEQLLTLAAMGADPRRLDIENSTEKDFADAFAGADAVVFSAGGGADGNVDRKRTVDLGGSLKTIEGAKAAGVRRVVQVSAWGVDRDPDADRGDAWTAYVMAKREADTALRDSGLDWTILRPGGLTDDAATGRVGLAPAMPSGSISRADVAHVIADCLDRPDTIGHQWELISGRLPVPVAIDAALS